MVKVLRDLTGNSVIFSTLATSNIKFLLFLLIWINKRISSISEKKVHDHRRKVQENDNCLEDQSSIWAQFYLRIYDDSNPS